MAVVLSAQSTDKGVNKVTTKLFNLAKKPSEMVKLGEKKIRETIKNIGLYNSKAKNLFLLSNIFPIEVYFLLLLPENLTLLISPLGNRSLPDP